MTLLSQVPSDKTINTSQGRLISLSELAKVLRRRPSDLVLLGARGVGPRCFRIRGIIYYRLDDVAAWESSNNAADHDSNV
jgi:hypothetical protein